MGNLVRQPEDLGRQGKLLPHGSDRLYALGVYIRKDLLSGVVVDVDGEIMKYADSPEGWTASAPLEATDVNTVVGAVATLVGDLSARHAGFDSPVGLGVTLSGQVDQGNREVRRSRRLGWPTPVSLAERLERATGYATMVEHDVKALALAEQMFGLGQGLESFAVVTADIGVGAALVIHHRLWRGFSDEAGELGHLVVVPVGGRQCLCRNYGCLETVAGSDGILQAMRAAGLADVQDIERASQLAQQGDTLARDAFKHAGEVLGYGLSWLVNMLNLRLIVVRAGPAMLASGVYTENAERSFHEHVLHGATQNCELHILPRDQELGARSAASMALALGRPLPDQLAELGDAEP
jgi:predicted NBD/HSP70 family sugar kinase